MNTDTELESLTEAFRALRQTTTYLKLSDKELSECLENHRDSVLELALELEEKEFWFPALQLFTQTTIDLNDILIYLKAKHSGFEILTFDKDFQRLKRKFG